MRQLAVLALAALIGGCTSVNVRNVDSSAALQRVCIVNNPRVDVSDFVSVLQDGFDRHGIATAVVEQAEARACEVTLTYTALRAWDFKPLLRHAELRLWRGGKQIGSATYHLRGRGGLSLYKWQTTKTKMDPVIDQLLAGRTPGHT